MNDFRFNNGQQAEDIVTGFAGTITARADYISGCIQYCLQPRVGENGEYPEAHWLDENRILIVEDEDKEEIDWVAIAEADKSSGGPQDCPPCR